MKRMILSLALAAALCLPLAPRAGAAFTDISDDVTQVAAAALQGLGVVSGTSDTTFSPNETLTRAQMCTMAVNAMGDITDGKGNILAGALDNKGGHIGTERCLREGKWFTLLTGANTTIGCVMTNAKLSKVEANKLASIAHNAYAEHISPVHTDYDGDTIFTMNTGVRRPLNFLLLEIAAKEAMGRAIMNAASGIKYEIKFDKSAPQEEEEQ